MAQNLYNFVILLWKLHNPYCHNSRHLQLMNLLRPLHLETKMHNFILIMKDNCIESVTSKRLITSCPASWKEVFLIYAKLYILKLLFIHFSELYWNHWHQSKINLYWVSLFFYSRVFLLRQMWIVNYYVKNPFKDLQ